MAHLKTRRKSREKKDETRLESILGRKDMPFDAKTANEREQGTFVGSTLLGAVFMITACGCGVIVSIVSEVVRCRCGSLEAVTEAM